MSEATHEKSKHAKQIDIVIKILCVAVAFVMWIYVMMVESPEYEETFSHITVELINTENLVSERELAIYNGYGTMIDVTISGKKSVISKIGESDIVATADVSTISGDGGRYNCKINVDVPAGCQVVGMSQETVSVYLDKASQISVALSEQRENTNLPEGAFTGTIEFPVDMVNVTGPSNVLAKINKAVVVLDLAGVTKTTTLTEEVKLYDRNGNEIISPYIDYYPKSVTLEVPVYKKVTVNLDAYFKYGFLGYDNTTITIDPATVEVTGEVDVINKGNLIEPIELDEKLHFSGNRCYKTFDLETVDGVILSTDRVTVTAIVDNSIRTMNITVPGGNIMDTGAKPGVEYTYSREPVTVKLMGTKEALSALEPEDIMLVLDMSPYNESNSGTVRVKAEVKIDSVQKDMILEIGTYTIDVTFAE
ncbi:MAG: hypothetical protein E7627_05045 [Ruminococcaceae bacterium]|nr:hypothetical protein [Oscillospiraceae bacterium]